MRFVTLLAVADIGLLDSNGGSSSTGDGMAFSPELFFPKPNFHFDVFLATTGTGVGMMGSGGRAGGSSGSPRGVDDVREALLISRARDCDAVASVCSVWSSAEPGSMWAGVLVPLPFLAPRLRRLFVEGDREYISSSSCSSCSSKS